MLAAVNGYSIKLPAIRMGSQARLLWMIRTHPGISRAEIAQESGLSKATVSTLVADLMAQGILVETQATRPASGRRRIGLQINHTAGLALGVELTPTHCATVLTDLSGQIIRSTSQVFETLAPSDVARKAAASIKHITSPQDRIVGLGLGVPGVADATGETALLFAPNAWAGEIPLVSLVREQLDCQADLPITLVNTCHAGALGEHRSGAGQDIDDLVFISAGESIGAGLILAGELYLGHNGGAGELAHVVIDPNGPRCACGNLGCLEAMAGGQAVLGLTAKFLAEQGRDHSSRPDKAALLTLQDVIDAALAGDLAALAAVRQAGEYLGLAVAGLVNTLNPGRVVIGGKLAETGDTLLAPLRQAVLRRASPAVYSTVEIVQAHLGANAAAVGAAALAIDRYLLAYA